MARFCPRLWCGAFFFATSYKASRFVIKSIDTNLEGEYITHMAARAATEQETDK